MQYLQHVSERFDLARDITFDTRVTKAEWDETASLWEVTLDKGDPIRAHHVIMATGALSAPKTPDLPGLDTFGGAILHTAMWDAGVALAGKRVALFGTG